MTWLWHEGHPWMTLTPIKTTLLWWVMKRFLAERNGAQTTSCFSRRKTRKTSFLTAVTQLSHNSLTLWRNHTAFTALCSEVAVAQARKASHMTPLSWSPCIRILNVQRDAISADCVGMWCACVPSTANTTANQLHQNILSEVKVSTGSGIHKKHTQKKYKTKQLVQQLQVPISLIFLRKIYCSTLAWACQTVHVSSCEFQHSCCSICSCPSC